MQSLLFNLSSKPKLNGLYYDPKREIYVSYSNGTKVNEWNEEHFKEEGFTKADMTKVRERHI